MKRVITGVITAMLLFGASAYAENYNLNENSVSEIPGDTYKTVLIVKSGDKTTAQDIVYIGQAEGDNMFSSATRFYMKESPEDGIYELRLGGKSDGGSDISRFYIGAPIGSNDIKYDKIFKEDGNIGFGWENVDAAGFGSILIKTGDSIFCYNLDITITGGNINLGVYIEDVSNADTEAYLSQSYIDGNGSLVLKGVGD